MTERNQTIVAMRESVPTPTLEKIGRAFNISRERVRQILQREQRRQFLIARRLATEERNKAILALYEEGLELVLQGIVDEFSLPKDQVTQIVKQQRWIDVGEELGSLSMRTKRTLQRAGLLRWTDIERSTDDDLLNIRNFGIKCLREVRMAQRERQVPRGTT